MDELNKQNIGEETAAHPVGENTQPVPPADTGAQGRAPLPRKHSWVS